MTAHDDMCNVCAADAGTPWPEGLGAPLVGPCNWCGNGDRALMPFDDLEHTDFAEEAHHA
jgi:hypothetical protein